MLALLWPNAGGQAVTTRSIVGSLPGYNNADLSLLEHVDGATRDHAGVGEGGARREPIGIGKIG
jgi:hypothetical protein